MEIYRRPSSVQTRWSSFENPSAGVGIGAQTNRGHKGAPFASVATGETVPLLDIDGPGVVRRIWLTVSNRSAKMLRSLRIEMYWDGAASPAVSAPLGDFFGIALGRTTAFECEFFANPEGRSFVATIPMPFRKHARVTLTNESDETLHHFFYDINLTLEPVPADAMFFHAHFRRERPTKLGRDFEILPPVTGAGRFLGANIGVITDPLYDGSWWGEGEVKGYLDSDTQFPTLVGTGSEDYISTGWGQGRFIQRFHGATITDETNRQWCMYRYHVPDPVFFQTACRIVYQQIGGGSRDKLIPIRDCGAIMQPITAGAIMISEMDTPPKLEDLPAGSWVNFLRQDDVCSTAYFYLDRAENDLPKLAPVAERIAALPEIDATKRADG